MDGVQEARLQHHLRQFFHKQRDPIGFHHQVLKHLEEDRLPFSLCAQPGKQDFQHLLPLGGQPEERVTII